MRTTIGYTICGICLALTIGCDRKPKSAGILDYFDYIKASGAAKTRAKDILDHGTNESSQVWRSFREVFPIAADASGLTYDKAMGAWEVSFDGTALLWGRYLIGLSVPMTLGKDLGPVGYKPVKLLVSEIKSVNEHSDGRISIDFMPYTLELGAADWKAFQANPYSQTNFGMTMITNKPLRLARRALETYGEIK